MPFIPLLFMGGGLGGLYLFDELADSVSLLLLAVIVLAVLFIFSKLIGVL